MYDNREYSERASEDIFHEKPGSFQSRLSPSPPVVGNQQPPHVPSARAETRDPPTRAVRQEQEALETNDKNANHRKVANASDPLMCASLSQRTTTMEPLRTAPHIVTEVQAAPVNDNNGEAGFDFFEDAYEKSFGKSRMRNRPQALDADEAAATHARQEASFQESREKQSTTMAQFQEIIAELAAEATDDAEGTPAMTQVPPVEQKTLAIDAVVLEIAPNNQQDHGVANAGSQAHQPVACDTCEWVHCRPEFHAQNNLILPADIFMVKCDLCPCWFALPNTFTDRAKRTIKRQQWFCSMVTWRPTAHCPMTCT
jgi:hypothetical protein